MMIISFLYQQTDTHNLQNPDRHFFCTVPCLSVFVVFKLWFLCTWARCEWLKRGWNKSFFQGLEVLHVYCVCVFFACTVCHVVPDLSPLLYIYVTHELFCTPLGHFSLFNYPGGLLRYHGQFSPETVFSYASCPTDRLRARWCNVGRIISTNTGWTVVAVGDPRRMKPSGFGDPLTSPLAPSWGPHFDLPSALPNMCETNDVPVSLIGALRPVLTSKYEKKPCSYRIYNVIYTIHIMETARILNWHNLTVQVWWSKGLKLDLDHSVSITLQWSRATPLVFRWCFEVPSSELVGGDYNFFSTGSQHF